MTDLEHLQAYRSSRDRADLEPLIRRNLDWVHSSARRHLRNDEHLAADVVQAVFMALASKPPNLTSDAAIAGWLYQVTKYAAAGALRAAARRRRHEEHAAMLRSEMDTERSDHTWADVAPYLEACVAKLPEKDRQSVVLRFYQRRSFAEVGTAMGTTEEAARKRVGRAVERLRDMFGRKGVGEAQTSALAGVLLAHATTSAPASVAGMISVSNTTGQAMMLGNGALKMLAIAKFKAVAAVIALAMLPVMGLAVLAQLSATPTTPAAATTAPATQQADAVIVRVVDETGKAIERAEVYVLQLSTPAVEGNRQRRSSAGPIMTDQQGRASIAGLGNTDEKASITRSIYVRRPGELVGVERISFEAGDSRSADPITVRLFPSESVRGLVLIPDGHRAEDVRVKLLAAEIVRQTDPVLTSLSAQIYAQELHETWPELFSAQVGPNGQFILQNIPAAGRVIVSATGKGLGEVHVARNRFDTRTIELRMAPEAILTGVLTYKGQSQPARGRGVVAIPHDTSLLSLSPYAVLTDENGKFRIEGLPAGVYSLRAQRDPDRQWTMQTQSGIRVTPGQTVTDLKLEYEPGVVVKGRVAAQSSDDPVPAAQIAALSPAETNGEQVDYATTDQAGNFSMRLPTGKTKLYLAYPGEGYAPLKDNGARIITVADDGSISGDLAFAVTKTAGPNRPASTVKLSGEVVDPDGKPVARVVVGHEQPMPFDRDQNLTMFRPHAAQTDDAGRFELTIEAGVRHMLRITSPDYRGQSDPIVPKSGTDLPIRIIATPHPVLGEISGIVLDPVGAPLEGVRINPGSANNENIATDAQGKFTYPVRQIEQPTRIAMVLPGFETRNWNGIPSDAKDLKFILHPSTQRPSAEAKPVVPSASLIGQRAPQIRVESWVHLVDATNPPNVMSGNRKTLVLFCEDDDKVRQRITELQAAAARIDAQAVVLFSTFLHEVAARELLGDLKLACSVGVDQYVPANEYRVNGATRIAYGAERMNRIYLIGADGALVSDNFNAATAR